MRIPSTDTALGYDAAAILDQTQHVLEMDTHSPEGSPRLQVIPDCLIKYYITREGYSH